VPILSATNPKLTGLLLNPGLYGERPATDRLCYSDAEFGRNQWRNEWGWGVQALPLEIPKAPQNRAKLNPIVKTVKKMAEFRTPTLQDVRKKGSKILNLPPVRNCNTLAMTNNLVVIISSLKVPKIKKILLYEMKFLLPNYSCLQNP